MAQLAKINEISTTRHDVAVYYNQKLESIPEVTVPQSDLEDITPFLYYIRVPADCRDAFRRYLSEQSIDTGIHWQPGHWFSMFKDCRRGDLSVTDRIGHEVVSLPLHSMMEQADVERVVSAVRGFFGRGAGS